MYLNQSVAYKSDPGLYGTMILKKLENGWAFCETHPETATDNAHGEWFREDEIDMATKFFLVKSPTNMPATPGSGPKVDVPDAPPDNW